ncbi:MAG: GNAT family N-acetyltransferase [Thermodesulfobacteriota bacterium]
MSLVAGRTSALLRLRAAYARLPEEVRHCLRPLNLLDELASFLPSSAHAAVHGVTSRARRLRLPARATYAVRRLEGVAPDGTQPLVVRLATDEPSARYWSRLLFAAPPRETRERVLPARAVLADAARTPPGVDLALWQLSWPIGRSVVADVVPSWVPLRLATDRPLCDIVRGEPIGRGSRKDDVRRARKLGLTARLTSDAADVERFRRDLYEPYIAQRFGDAAVLLPARAFRHARRRGWLLLLERDGAAVAGALLEPRGRELHVLAFGTSPTAGDAPAGIEACYYHVIRLAVERGFARLQLGTVRPVLTDGVLRYKRKWGASLAPATTLDRFLLRHRNTPATRAVLTAAPLIVDRGRAGLVALAAARGVDAQAQLRHVDLPGLSSLVLYLEPGVPPPAAAPCSKLEAVTAPLDAAPARTPDVA